MLVKFIYAVISVLGRLPFASVYTDSIYIRFWLVFIYASFSAACLYGTSDTGLPASLLLH